MTTTILTRDIATRYAALRAAVLASVGPEQFAQIEYDTQQSLLESAPVPEDADLVSIADLSDLDGDEDTDPVDDEETRREVKAARTTYSWIVRFEVCGTWIADGFDLTHERALDMLATDLGMANIGEELNARVIAAPPADTIAQEQGYKDAADIPSRLWIADRISHPRMRAALALLEPRLESARAELAATIEAAAWGSHDHGPRVRRGVAVTRHEKNIRAAIDTFDAAKTNVLDVVCREIATIATKRGLSEVHVGIYETTCQRGGREVSCKPLLALVSMYNEVHDTGFLGIWTAEKGWL